MWAAGIGAVLCLIYYGVIVLYSGLFTSFAWFWPAAAVWLGMICGGAAYLKHHPKAWPMWVPVSALTFCGASFAILCAVEVLIFLNAATPETPYLDYVIVLGAKVEEGHITMSLQKRLDKAIEYSQRNPETVLILSGGRGDDEPISEARAMYEYLKYNGVPEDHMILEGRSTSTVENIAYSKAVIDALETEKKPVDTAKRQTAPGPYLEAETKPLQIGILTSDFHVFRAKKIAKKWGLSHVHGIASKSDPILFVHLCVRECAAILKDKLMGNM